MPWCKHVLSQESDASWIIFYYNIKDGVVVPTRLFDAPKGYIKNFATRHMRFRNLSVVERDCLNIDTLKYPFQL